MSASRNIRLAWIAQELAKGKSRASIVLDCMVQFKGVSEKTARKDLKEILQRITEIDNETLAEARTHVLEAGWALMQEARSLAQMGPAVNQFKNICTLMGLMSDRSQDQSAAPHARTLESDALDLPRRRRDVAHRRGVSGCRSHR